MSDKESRTSRNAVLYKQLDDHQSKMSNEWTDAANNLQQKLLSLSNSFFNIVYQNIDVDMHQDDLYNIQSTSYDEKLTSIRNDLQNIMMELNDITDNQISGDLLKENSYALKPNEYSIAIETRLNEIERDLESITSLRQAKKEFVNAFEQTSGEIKNKVILNDKILKNNELSFRVKVEEQKKENKNNITRIKKNLNSYKTKWIWYVVVVGLCVIGAILAIVIPSVI
ncbi:hypothetical protein [Mesoplasma lactucae]|uniref:hypothetical protein n=1 Tax=Mesoplasma lactucae TaxID=138853 RepID=UPI002022AB4B|nr:hypothetical protein [Mesoplasma lactucae]MCL8216434.1 hypothetical protein [Mesoplasma lactucae ATCC 49193]